LDVIGKRSDGYHDLVSVMQSISLCDELEFFITDGGGVQLEADNVPCGFPLDSKNLIVRAAKFLLDEYKITHGVKIKLQKNIPMGAGLGGGSSDCAATLHGLNELFALGIPLHRLVEIGMKFGADVPFCLLGGTAVAEGIGEKLTPLAPHPPCYIVLVNPGIHVSTGEIFGRLQINVQHEEYENFMQAYKTGDISQIAKSFFNIFTPVTSALHPEISQAITDLKNAGAINAAMTGTGSTVFGYFEKEIDALEACDKIKRTKCAKRIFVADISPRNCEAISRRTKNNFC